MRDAVIFKGTKEGLVLILNQELSFEAIKEGLDRKLKSSKEFFVGAKIIQFKGKLLNDTEYIELKEILINEYAMHVTATKPKIEDNLVEDNEHIEEVVGNPSQENLHYEIVDKSHSLFVKGTIRSGQVIAHDGNIIIIGDVNPGAYIKASNNIIIMGNLRGIAHGGSNGNYNATISAFNLIPTQLRIGDIVTKAPNGEKQICMNFPEIAYVKNGIIMVSPYQNTK